MVNRYYMEIFGMMMVLGVKGESMMVVNGGHKYCPVIPDVLNRLDKVREKKLNEVLENK
jgi:hypothetical protein